MTTKAARRPSERFLYDAALSFAGENRAFAKQLFRQLRRRGHSVFFDENRQAALWLAAFLLSARRARRSAAHGGIDMNAQIKSKSYAGAR